MRHRGRVQCGRRQRNPREPAIVKSGNSQRNREPIQPREIAAENENELEYYRDEPGGGADWLRSEIGERHYQLDEMVKENSGAVNPGGQPVEVPTQWIWNRLRFKIVVQAGELTPTGISAQFDESGPEHNAEEHPAPYPEKHGARSDAAATRKNGEKPGLEQNGFPPESVKRLADVDE